jgi:hypothetical protein
LPCALADAHAVIDASAIASKAPGTTFFIAPVRVDTP